MCSYLTLYAKGCLFNLGIFWPQMSQFEKYSIDIIARLMFSIGPLTN
ncbi:hypothetical protein SOHN41_02531 [Shewanella sp. HN-41]|nr:hypothetical protein SOHN41_02531 [Shewanella sp. HN-41]